MMTIEEEIQHLITLLSHPAGFDAGMGGTDTTAAIVGALLGAKLGMGSIDKDLVRDVEESNRLIELDSQLYNRSNDSFLKRG